MSNHPPHERRAARLCLAVVAVTAAAAAPAPSSHAADAYPCKAQVSKPWSKEPVQNCPLIAPESGGRIPVYAKPVKRATGAALPKPDGWLNGTSGQHFVCQRSASRFYHSQGWRNVWWAYTAADSGIGWGWVPEVYFKGGDNDEADGGLRRCPSSGADSGSGDGGMTPQNEDREEVPAGEEMEQRDRPRPPRFELPFTCGQRWRLDTWDHSPALDMVRHPQRKTQGSDVRAPAGGTVKTSGWDDGGGNVVQIKHKGGWYTTFIHLKKRSVKVDQKVKRGTKIGTVGRTGDNGHTPHLHFEVGFSRRGVPDWGVKEAPRHPVRFHGRKYSGNGRTWKKVVSRNCRSNEAIQQNRR